MMSFLSIYTKISHVLGRCIKNLNGFFFQIGARILIKNYIDIAANNVQEILIIAPSLLHPITMYMWKHDSPRMNILKVIRKRKRLHCKAKQSNHLNDWFKFRRVRNKCMNNINKCKKDFSEKQISQIQSPNMSSQNW